METAKKRDTATFSGELFRRYILWFKRSTTTPKADTVLVSSEGNKLLLQTQNRLTACKVLVDAQVENLEPRLYKLSDLDHIKMKGEVCLSEGTFYAQNGMEVTPDEVKETYRAFPHFDRKEDFIGSVDLPKEKLKELLNVIQPDSARNYGTCGLVEFQDDCFTITGTDGFRLVQVSEPGSGHGATGQVTFSPFVISHQAIKSLVNMPKTKDETLYLKHNDYESATMFVKGPMTLFARMPGVNYPRYQAAIPKDPCFVRTCRDSDFPQALKNLLHYCDKSQVIELGFRQKHLVLTAFKMNEQTKEQKTTSIAVALEDGAYPDFDVRVNGRFLLDAVKSAKPFVFTITYNPKKKEDPITVKATAKTIIVPVRWD